MSRTKKTAKQYDRSKGYASSKDTSEVKEDVKASKDQKDSKFYKKTKGSNDLAWHTPDAELLKRASTIPWTWQTGERIVLNTPYYTYSSDASYDASATVPGFIVVRDQISVGGIGMIDPSTTDRTYMNPTYNAANTLLTEMRAKARLRNTYDAPDVLMLNIAMANIYAGVFFAIRAAQTVRMFTYENHYMPEALLTAQGLDPTWFKRNQYTFITELNVLISEINKVYIPKRMHYFELLQERYSYYYTEGDSIRDQIYFFTPAFLNSIEYQPSANYASWVKPVMCFPGKWQGGQPPVTYYDSTGLWTGEQLITGLRYMLNQVLTHDSTPDITGDMENAFGSSERFLLGQANPMDIAMPVFDEEILETIHNAKWSWATTGAYQNYQGGGSQDPKFCIVQDASDNRIGMYDIFDQPTNGIFWEYYRSESSCRLLDVHKEPSPEKTFAITRLVNATGRRTVDSGDPTTMYIQIVHSTDLICEIDYYIISVSGGVYSLSRITVPMLYVPTSNEGLITNNMSAFHYRPFRSQIDAATGQLEVGMPNGSLDIYAKGITLELLSQTNRISLNTLLGAYQNMPIK